ncbi:MAG: choice-of-anchor B family protein [Rhodothermia bacterium]|nr:MAG: choice-of-anchor B family protein [Rhodothermia bacterium]
MIRSLFLIAIFALLAIPASAQSFGSAVAVSGDEVIAGVGRNSSTPGSLYFYKQSEDGTWVETRTLSASDASEADGFGRSVDISGRTMAVGAPLANAVYIFSQDENGTWQESARLTNEAEGFGGAVSVSKNTLIVGAPVGRRSEGTGAAFAYVKNDEGSWEFSTQLIAEGISERGAYGSVVIVAEGRAAVGEPGANNSTGAVHTFTYDSESGEWAAGGILTNPGLSEGNRFGSALLVAGLHMAVGIPGSENRIGAVALFKANEETGEWEFEERVAPFSAQGGESFGASLEWANGALWVGAPGYGGSNGAIYKFEPSLETQRLAKTWVMEPTDMQARARFGSAIAANDQVAAIGAARYDGGEGAVFPFANGDDGWIQGNPVWTESKSFASVTGGQIDCEDGMAADFSCSEIDMVSFLSVKDLGGKRGIRTNDIWGWEDPETGHEIAIVGMSDKTSFVDVTDPDNPVFLGTLPMTEGANSAVWRDIKVYSNHAYIVSDGAGDHGVQVFDLTQLRNVTDAPVVFDAVTVYQGIASAHNIVINEETGFAYVVGSRGGGETCGGGLHMLNLEDPANPTFAGCFADPATGRKSTGYTHDAQCVIYRGPDEDYKGREICLGSNETALSIADVTDKDNPVAVSMATYPNVAYTHQGWLTDDQQYFYMNDEGDEPQGLVEGTRTLIWDVSDLDEPQLAAEYIAETTETDHNLYIKGDLMYQSNYGAGFRVLDISNRETPVEVAYFDTDPNGGGGSSWSNYPFFRSGVIVVTGGKTGLFIVRKKEVDI